MTKKDKAAAHKLLRYLLQQSLEGEIEISDRPDKIRVTRDMTYWLYDHAGIFTDRAHTAIVDQVVMSLAEIDDNPKAVGTKVLMDAYNATFINGLDDLRVAIHRVLRGRGVTESQMLDW